MTTPAQRRGLGLRDRVVLAALLGGARLLQFPAGWRHLSRCGRHRHARVAGDARPSRARAGQPRPRLPLPGGDRAGLAADRRGRAQSARLDRLVRSAFQHWVRAYAEGAVAPRYSADDLRARVDLETPETAAEALGPRIGDAAGRLFVGFHFGAIELAALYASRTGKVPVSGPMESVENPAMRAYFERTRRKLGIDILPLSDAAHELTTRLARGEVVALVADRAVRGAGSRWSCLERPPGCRWGGRPDGRIAWQDLRRRHVAHGLGTLGGSTGPHRPSRRTVTAGAPPLRPRAGGSPAGADGRQGAGAVVVAVLPIWDPA